MKKAFAILCFAALVLSTSSISYVYWVEEQIHEKEIFAKIDVGEIEKSLQDNKNHKIKLLLKERDYLPVGYVWEEEGREFSYKGMFYDIVSITKKENGWEIIALSDEDEAFIVANQNNSKREGHHFKSTRIQLIFIAPIIEKQLVYFYSTHPKFPFYISCLFNTSLVKFFPPPELI